ncbi:uncharacterized protein TNCV_4806051 [Trichonephila clavipes]|nr:uncharacterized protein TNCV_4806051 [Trichonephila clavipes]
MGSSSVILILGISNIMRVEKCMSKSIVIFAVLCSTTSRKNGKQHSHFVIPANFLAKELSAKVSVGSGVPVSNQVSLEDKPRRGQPSDFDDLALLAAMEEDESLTT